jgi:redox-sensitive bicupin YhaK (pirin superfamily)
MSIRPINRLVKSKPALEGAGVHLRRAFGFDNTSDFDPFLLLDDFRNDVPGDYLAGFPWHPHRGIETITYVLAGTVEHGDSLGNQGVIGAGDVQWMTAGSGIIHQEMPKGDPTGRMHGFQLWGNLPSSLKMAPPRYQEVKSVDIPVVTDDDGTQVRIVCGTFWGKTGPVQGVAAEPIYLDVSVPPGRRRSLPVETTRHAFAYVFGGSGDFCNASAPLAVPTEAVRWLDTAPPAHADNRTLVLFERGDEVEIKAGEDGIRFLLVSGKPLKEPVAWYGPIVMNTQKQLQQAFDELERGTFLRHAAPTAAQGFEHGDLILDQSRIR